MVCRLSTSFDSYVVRCEIDTFDRHVVLSRVRDETGQSDASQRLLSFENADEIDVEIAYELADMLQRVGTALARLHGTQFTASKIAELLADFCDFTQAHPLGDHPRLVDAKLKRSHEVPALPHQEDPQDA